MGVYDAIKGALIIYKAGEYDNELKDEITSFTVEFKTLSTSATISFTGEDREPHRVNLSGGVNTSTHEIRSRGRVCALLDFYAFEYDTCYRNIHFDITLCCADSDGNFRKLSTHHGFTIPWAGNDYTGSDEMVITRLESFIQYPRQIGFGNFGFLDNVFGVDEGFRSGTFSLNIPMFTDEDNARKYVGTGIIEDDENQTETETEDDAPEWYYIYSEYQIDNLGHTSTFINQVVKEFKLISNNDRVAFVNVGGNKYELQCTNNQVLLAIKEVDPDTGLTHIIGWQQGSFSDVKITVYDGVNGNVKGDLTTNIQKVNDLSEATGDPNNYIFDAYNGKDDNMNLTSLSVSTNFINAYYVTGAELNNIAKVLYANDQNVIDALKNGLWMYSGNPVDAVIDLCYYPIDLSPFITSRGSAPLKFGAYVYGGEISGVPAGNLGTIQGTHGTYTLVNQRIQNIYNDYRDITNVLYTLYLPYYGIVELDNVVVGKTLRVDAKFDVYTSGLKYYVFINGALSGCYETAIGRHMSVIGNNWISKSSGNINSVIGGGANVVGLIGSVMTGNVGGVVSSGVGLLQNTQDITKKPTTTTAGTVTSGLNIYDPLSCFLIIEQYETIKPTTLKSDYGMPCYKIAFINQCRGYTEIADCKLNTKATDEERNEIMTLLSNGVII